jgi:hypothetical protein
MPSRSFTPDPPAPARRGPPVWLPWLMAPGFLLLPIGGCGLAATLRRPAMAGVGSPATPPVATVVPVAPVMPGPHTVAWQRSAD